MEPDRMNRFFSNLNEWINSKKKVTESILFDLSEKAAELLEKSDYQKLKKESFFLMETLELYRQFDLTPEQENIFALGEIHGTFRLANAMERRSDMNQNLENDLRECQERYVVFDAVRECPGIQHKKLAQFKWCSAI